MKSKTIEERDRKVVDWLLEPEQPAVRYFALLDLLDRKKSDPQVRSARSRLSRVGWAAEQLRRLKPNGFWESHEPRNVKEWVDFLYFPKFGSTNWRALVLSDLGLDSSNPKIRKIAKTIFDYKLQLGSPFNFFHEEVCIAGNTARMMARFGYSDDRRVGKLFDWLMEDQRDNGGWNCSQGTPGTLDCWEALAAFAALPKQKRSSRMEDSISRGAEFYLERRLFQEGRKYPPWFRFHYPNHYFYDILVGLDVITQLGYGGDRRLGPALDLLKKKRRADGTWHMEKLHPDFGAGIGPNSKKSRPLLIEEPVKPSKMITLKALQVLKRVGEAV